MGYGKNSLDTIVRDLAEHLTNFFEARYGVQAGTTYGILGENPDSQQGIWRSCLDLPTVPSLTRPFGSCLHLEAIGVCLVYTGLGLPVIA